MKYRIIERTSVAGGKDYVIQQGHWLLKWFWENRWTEDSLEKAQEGLNFIKGNKIKEEKVVYEED